MTTYELKKETDSFRWGYWDGFQARPKSAPAPSRKPSDFIDYHRGYLMGVADFKNGR